MATLPVSIDKKPEKKFNKNHNSLAANFKKKKMLYFMILPGIVFYLVFKYLPMCGLIVSFEQYNPFEGISALWTSKFVGFYWFSLLFRQPEFWNLLRNTFLISLYFIIFGFPVPIILALLLNEIRNSSFKKMTQTVTYIPHFLSWAVVGSLVIQILSPESGLINNILSHLGIEPVYFLVEKSYFRSIVVGVGIWKEVGWDSIIYLAALSSIDPTFYEAAVIDGANRWKQTLYVTIPCLLPIMTVLLILSFGRILETGFDEIFMLYSPKVYPVGDVFSTYSYRVGIGKGQFSYITALGLFQNVVNLIMLLTVNKMSKVINGNGIW